MAIEVACPICKKRYHLRDDMAGKRARCKACGSNIDIPGAAPQAGPFAPGRSSPSKSAPAKSTPARPSSKAPAKAPSRPEPLPSSPDDSGALPAVESPFTADAPFDPSNMGDEILRSAGISPDTMKDRVHHIKPPAPKKPRRGLLYATAFLLIAASAGGAWWAWQKLNAPSTNTVADADGPRRRRPVDPDAAPAATDPSADPASNPDLADPATRPASRPADVIAQTPATLPAHVGPTPIVQPPASRPASRPATQVAQIPPPATQVARVPDPPLPAAPFEPKPEIQNIQPIISITFEDAVYPQTSLRWMVITRKLDGVDVFQRCSLDPYKEDVALQVPVQPAGRIALSPDGELLVRTIKKPVAAVEVYSFKDQKLIQTLDVDAEDLIGFISPTQLLLRPISDGAATLQIWDAAVGSLSRSFAISPYAVSHGYSAAGISISPDGRRLALIAEPAGAAPSIEVYDLAARALVGKVDIANTASFHPVGIAWADDSAQFAFLYEAKDETHLVVVTAAAKQSADYAYDGKLRAQLTDISLYNRRAIDWIPQSQVLLLYGTGFFDVSSGKSLGRLSETHIHGQRVISPTLVQFILQDQGKLTLSVGQITGVRP